MNDAVQGCPGWITVKASRRYRACVWEYVLTLTIESVVLFLKCLPVIGVVLVIYEVFFPHTLVLVLGAVGFTAVYSVLYAWSKWTGDALHSRFSLRLDGLMQEVGVYVLPTHICVEDGGVLDLNLSDQAVPGPLYLVKILKLRNRRMKLQLVSTDHRPFVLIVDGLARPTIQLIQSWKPHRGDEFQ